MADLQQIIDYTNAKLKDWYDNVKIEYGVLGKGTCRFAFGLIIIDYEENGEEKQWSYVYYPQESHKFYFNVWMEQY